MSYEFGAWQAAEANAADALAALNRTNATIRRQNARIEQLETEVERMRGTVAERDATIASLLREAEVRSIEVARSGAVAAGHGEAASVLATLDRAEAFKALPSTPDLPIRSALAQCWIAAHAKAASATPNLQVGRAQDLAGDIPWLFVDEEARAAFRKGVEEIASRKRREAEQSRLRAEQAAEAARLAEERQRELAAATLQEAADRAAERKAAKDEEDRVSGVDRLLFILKGRSAAELRGIQASLASEPRKAFMSRKWSVLGVTYATEELARTALDAFRQRVQQHINWSI